MPWFLFNGRVTAASVGLANDIWSGRPAGGGGVGGRGSRGLGPLPRLCTGSLLGHLRML